jgi:hypothetical protein
MNRVNIVVTLIAAYADLPEMARESFVGTMTVSDGNRIKSQIVFETA